VELTPIFNEAAQGGAGHTPVGEGPRLGGPSDHSSAAAPIQTAEEQNDQPVDATARQFEGAAAPSADQQLGDEPRSQKEGMLEMLERGRAKPKAAHNLKPSPHVEKAVHTMHEGWREKFIHELRSELAISDDLDQRYVLDEEFDDDFGPRL
jgi:hypothetical protein